MPRRDQNLTGLGLSATAAAQIVHRLQNEPQTALQPCQRRFYHASTMLEADQKRGLVKAIARRLRRLEIQFGPADGNPRERFRLVVQPAGLRNPGLEGATCRRTLCPNGTVMESVEFSTSSNGRELTDAELDAWVASFPIEPIADGIRLRPLPPQWGPDGSVPE